MVGEVIALKTATRVIIVSNSVTSRIKMPENQGKIYKIPFRSKWATFSDEYLRGLSDSDEQAFRWLIQDYEDNRMSYFLPHGMPWHDKTIRAAGGRVVFPPSKYSKEWKNDGLAFLNDYDTEISMVVAPSKTGKSYQGADWILLRSIKCKPEWSCFTSNGIICPDWSGDKLVRVFSFQWTNVGDVWKRYQELIPRYELGPRAPHWGYFADNTKNPKEKGRPRPLSFKSGQEQEIRLEESGTLISFNCYSQGEAATEGYECDLAHFDEQPTKSTWNGFTRGSQTRGDYTPCCFTLTGRVLEDRADTGMAGWVYRDLWLGVNTYGRTVKRYHLSVDSTPDSIISPKKKRQAYDQWANPEINRSEQDERAGVARYWGGWESGGGAVIDNFYPEHHIIPDYNRDHKTVEDATKYRGIDHGLGRPCTCAWLEMFSWGDLVMFREYYEKGHTIPYHARKMVDMSGNTMAKVDDFEDDDTMMAWKVFEEVFQKETYVASVLDSRSFASPSQEREGQTIGQVYQDCGFDCNASVGYRNEKLVPQMKRWFDLDPERPHIMWQFQKRGIITPEVYEEWLAGRDGDYKNGSMIYFVSSLSWTFEELSLWAKDPKSGLPKSDNDHIVGGALKYALAEEPHYEGRRYDTEKSFEEENEQLPNGRKYINYP